MQTQFVMQFNMPVTTPDGPGYLVAKGEDGKVLVAVKRTVEKKSRCLHLWYWPNQIEELRQPLCQPSQT